MTDFVDEKLQLLLLDETSFFEPRIAEMLAGRWKKIEITRVQTQDAFVVALAFSEWDMTVSALSLAVSALTSIQETGRSIPLIVVCHEKEIEQAFALNQAEIIDIVPVNSLQRLPFILQREQSLRHLREQPPSAEVSRATQALTLDDPLRRSEIRFRTVIEGFNDVILIIDSFQVIRYANMALERVLGYSNVDLLGLPLSDLFDPEEELMLTDLLTSILEIPGSVQTFEHRLRRADGGWEIAETTGQNLIDPAGQSTVLVHVRSITVQKQAERALRESEQRFQHMADTAPAMIWMSDETGVSTFLSRGWYEYTGQTEGAALGDGWLNVVHADDRQRVKEAFLEANEKRIPFQIDYRLWRSDEEYRWVIDAGRPNILPDRGFVGYIGSVIDIHERKAAEQALRRSEVRYRRVIEDQTEFICRYDMNFTLTFVNGAYRDAYGKQPGQMVGTSWLSYFLESDRETVVMHTRFLNDLSPVSTAEYQSMMPDGSIRWFQWTNRLLVDDANKVVEYQGVGRDITERRQAERELAALYNATSYLFKADSLRNLGHQIVEAVVQEFQQSDCGLMLVDKPRQKILRVARTGQYNIHPDGPLTLDGSGLVPLAIRTGRPVYVADVTQEANYLRNEARTKSELVIPLKTVNGVIAVLDLQRAEVDAFSERDRRILMAYAERAAAAIENMQLYERNNQYAAELEVRVMQRTAQLNEAKERVEIILNNSPDAVLLTGLDLSIQKTNFAFDRMFNCDPDTFFDQSFAVLIHPEDANLVMMSAVAVIANKAGQIVEIRPQRRDGSVFHAELSIGYVGAGNAQDTGLVCIVHDITERKRAEQALDESNRFIRRITEITPNLIYIYDIQTRDNVYTNRSIPATMGYSSDEGPYPDKQSLVMHPDDLARFLEYREQIINSTDGEIWQFEYRMPHKTDGWRWFLSRDTVFRRNMQGRAIQIISTATDITARKLVEEALRESEEKFRLLMEAAPVAVIITDHTGHITLVNIQAEILFGYNRQELFGLSVEILVDEMTRAHHVERRKHYMSEPQMRHMGLDQELFARRKDGSLLPVEIELSYVETHTGLLVMAFIVDITERKERERQLRYHASLQENVTDAVIATDLTFRIQSWNQAAERIYGWSKEDVIGRSVNEILRTQMSDETSQKQIQQLFEQGHWTGEVLQFHRDGTPIDILGSVVLFKDENNRSFGIVAVNHDITNRKKAEQALYEALAKEKELGELKSRFVSMASHEFRNPLASIHALTETISEYRNKLSDEQIEQKLSKIKEQVNYLKTIMEDVLLLGQLQTRRIDFNPVLLRLSDLFEMALDEFRTRSEVSGRIVYLPHITQEEARLDKKLMRQVISNLVANALKYSPSDAQVTILVETVNNHLILDVHDEGIGIPPADLKHLFEPFHRATNVGTIAGTGLGLFITKESVELHGGIISVASRVDQGTTFTVKVPLSS